jgi:hypothetical protein
MTYTRTLFGDDAEASLLIDATTMADVLGATRCRNVLDDEVAIARENLYLSDAPCQTALGNAVRGVLGHTTARTAGAR